MTELDLRLCPGPSESNKTSFCDVCDLQIHSTGPEVVHQLPHLPWGIAWVVKNGSLSWREDRTSRAIAVRFHRGKPLIHGPSERLLAGLVLGTFKHLEKTDAEG